MSTEWTDGGPSPVMVAGSSSPAATLSALLFSVVLSMAAPRPRAARYTAATAFGRLVTAASTTPPVTICGIPKCVPIDVPDLFHDHAGQHDHDQGGHGQEHVAAAAVPRVDDLLEFLLLLGDRHGQPALPAAGHR